MFDVRSFPVIEGGGKYPEIKYQDNGIGVVNPNRLLEAMKNFRDSGARDLNNRGKVAWFNGKNDEIEDLLTIFGVESASNRTKDGEILNINNVPYNAHAEYNVPGMGESYGLMQIDVSGDNKTYVMMAMDDKYRTMLNKEKTVAERNALGNQLFEENREEAIKFLKDINNLDKHLLIASTIYNDNGKAGWRAHTNYIDPNGDEGFKELYDMVAKANEKRVYKSYSDELMQINRKNTADMLEILELRDKMPVSIEGRAMQLIDAYNTMKRESPDMTEFADKKIEKLKPFAGIYGS
tara:strand:+ start:33231 stop:34112 length:882 start_codon:yes stop_codon:yes gene_type:complete